MTIAPSKRRPFDPERDMFWFEERLKKLGKLHEMIDIAHVNGLALEELIEREFNKLVGSEAAPQ